MTNVGRELSEPNRRTVRAIALVGVGVMTVSALAATVAQATTPRNAPNSSAVAAEASLPVMTGFSFSPSVIDVRKQTRYVTVTVRAHNSVPITDVRVGFRGPMPAFGGATLALASGTRANGVWKGKVRINRWVRGGVWSVQYVQLDRAHGSPVLYEPATSDLSQPWNPTWRVKLHVSSIADVTRPIVHSFKVSPISVNTTRASKKVTVTIVVTDSQSGVRGAYLEALAPGHLPGRSDGKFVKSRTRPNTWVATITIPRHAGAGMHRWTLRMSTADKVLNLHDFSPADLLAKHWQSTLKVTSKA